MENFRPLSIGERFFDKPVILHVPYSILPEELPPITAPLETPPILDMSADQFTKPSTGGNFVQKYWFWILIGAAIGTGIYYIIQQNRKKEKEN